MFIVAPNAFGAILDRARSAQSTYGALAPGDHADEFDSIALRQKTLYPFPLMKCGGIVLD